MSSVKMTAAFFQVEGPIPEEAFRVVGELMARAVGSPTPPPPTSFSSLPAPAAAITQRSSDAAAAAASNGQATPKIRQKRRPRSSEPANGHSSNGHQDPTEKLGTGAHGKVTTADRIAQHIELRGPLTTPRLAQLLTTSEKSIALTMGHAKGRFLRNDNDEWYINPSRR